MRLLSVFLASLLALPSMAQADERPPASGDSFCVTLSEFAAAAMTQRQAESPLSKMLQAIEEVEAKTDSKELMRQVVLQAYESPAYSSEAYQAREVRRFENEVFMACLRARSPR